MMMRNRVDHDNANIFKFFSMDFGNRSHRKLPDLSAGVRFLDPQPRYIIVEYGDLYYEEANRLNCHGNFTSFAVGMQHPMR